MVEGRNVADFVLEFASAYGTGEHGSKLASEQNIKYEEDKKRENTGFCAKGTKPGM